jgi:hypothetical protein
MSIKERRDKRIKSLESQSSLFFEERKIQSKERKKGKSK